MTEVFKSATSRTAYFELVDSTTGLPKTGILYSDVTGSYVRSRAARTAITMATLGSASASWATGGFIKVDDTNQPGIYRFDVPDAAFATGVDEVIVTVKATGCRTQSRGFVLVDWNKQVASIPNVAAAASGGLPTVDGSNRVKADLDTIKTQAITCAAGATILASVGTASTSTAQTGDSYAIVNSGTFGNAQLVRATTPANTLDVSSTGEAGLDFNNVKQATGATTLTNITVPTVTTLTGHTAQTGDAYAIVNHASYGNAKLVRSTTPANTLNVSATGEADANMTKVNGTAAGTDDGTAQAGGASTITLASGASATNDIYVPREITIVGGTGSGQTRYIASYVGSTKVATVDAPWATNPDNTSKYQMGGSAAASKVVGNVGGNVTGSVGSVTTKTGFELSAAGLDLIVVETGVNARQALAIIGAATAGKASGLATTTAVYYAVGASGTSTTRVSATVDSDGNRTATTLTVPT